MNRKEKTKQLQQLATMLRDRDLAALRRSAAGCAATRALLAGLEAAPAPDLEPLTAARVQQAHQIWADRRRAALNLQLARQTAEWLNCRQQAAHGFGKAEVLSRLIGRL